MARARPQCSSGTGRNSKSEDGDVQTHTPRDLEHRRLLGRLQPELPEVPGQAEVGDQGDGDERVAQEAHEHGGPAHGIQVLSPEDVDHARRWRRRRRRPRSRPGRRRSTAPRRYVLDRCVLPPSPSANRATSEIAPNAISAIRHPVEGGQQRLPDGARTPDARHGLVAGGVRRRQGDPGGPPLEARRPRSPNTAPRAMTAGGTACRAKPVYAGNALSPTSGNPSFSNGTDDRYSTSCRPPPSLRRRGPRTCPGGRRCAGGLPRACPRGRRRSGRRPGRPSRRPGPAWSSRSLADVLVGERLPVARRREPAGSARSAQWVHFWIFGASESHSAAGTPHGQAQMQ